MTASEVLSNNKARTALSSLQMLNRLAAQAFANAMSYHDGCGNVNPNAEAQMEHRENEFRHAVEAQARWWKMDVKEVYALAIGEHKLQQQ